LNLLPFAALHDGKQYLLGLYEFNYLTSGRDLLRDPVGPSTGPPLVLADPDYAAQLPRAVATAAGTRALEGDTLDLYRMLRKVHRLPATRKEAEALSRLLPSAEVHLDQEATEEILRKAQAPQMVHIATHGLFLPGAPRPKGDGAESRALSRGLLPPSQTA